MNTESPIQSVNSIINIGEPYRTGDFPGSFPYIGDPIVPYTPPVQIIPGKVDFFPLGPSVLPNTNAIWTTGISLTPHP